MSDSHEHAISIGANYEKKTVDGVEKSSDTDLIATTLKANEKVASVYKKLVEKLADFKKANDHDHDHDRESAKPKIQRVPIIMREQKQFEKYYEPRWISIGPIHHGKPKLQHETEYKLTLSAKFIDNSDLGTEALYSKIKEEVEELKKCFHEDVIKDYDDVSLSWMLFFDGCSTLQLISSYVYSDCELKTLKIKNDHIALAQHDLFLLENQIPFRVLKVLMESCSKERCDKLRRSIKEFVRFNVMAPEKYTKNLQIEIDYPEPAHLLELLRSAILAHPKEHHSGCGIFTNLWKSKKDPTKELEQGNQQQSFRSVLDLKTAGIDLKPSESCSLRDITFTSLCFAGWLRLPPITVDDLTGPRFLNMIAYEMCPDNIDTDYEVASYISFLDSLIDYPTDVKELRSSRILHNLLGSDKEVANFFNEIGTDLVSSPVYKNVIAQVQSHYKSKWRTWMAQVYHDHFSSPWTIVAFLAAALALSMSGVQTWYTVKS